MLEVQAIYEKIPKGALPSPPMVPIVFYEHNANSLRLSAKLAHPLQLEPTEVRGRPVIIDESYHVYSVGFDYSAPTEARSRAIHGAGIHICFSVDEKEASKRLMSAIHTVDAAVIRGQFIAVDQYCWPGGTLYYWFASKLGLEAFLKEEVPRLNEALLAVAKRPFRVRGKSGYVRYGESTVSVAEVREVERPRRYDPGKWGYLHLYDYFNGRRYADLNDGDAVVDKKLADAFEKGFCMAYGHHWDYVKRDSAEAETLQAAHSLARFAQWWTE
jgi:hypothetical protein